MEKFKKIGKGESRKEGKKEDGIRMEGKSEDFSENRRVG